MLEMLAGKAAGSLFGGIGSALGGALGGGGPLMGGDAQSGAYGVTLDKAGMVFNFGDGNTTRTSSERTTSTPAPTPMGNTWAPEPAPMQAGGSWLMMAALGLVALGMMRRAKS